MQNNFENGCQFKRKGTLQSCTDEIGQQVCFWLLCQHHSKSIIIILGEIKELNGWQSF
jgi:hypothetical protein